ncbi:unknown [Bacteroides clarus CAG:160]|nr:unknown [Bacteroides clarus CAG:160]
MMHQFRLNIITIIKNTDSGKYASLQNQQQQIAHITGR